MLLLGVAFVTEFALLPHHMSYKSEECSEECSDYALAK